MIPVSYRLRIQALLRKGFSKASVARKTGVSLRSVKRIAKEPELGLTDDAAEHRRRGIGRPSIVQAFRPLVIDLLREHPEMKSAAILRRARSLGYPGGKSALYTLISSLRVPPVLHDPGLCAASQPARPVPGAGSTRLDTERLG